MINEPRTYYGIVSSLPNLSLEGTNAPEPQNLATQLADFMHPDDLNLLQLVYMPADHSNLLNKLYDNGKPFIPNGNFSPQDIERIASGKLMPYPYIDDFFTHWWQHHGKAEPFAETEKNLTAAYYLFMLGCGHTFTERWSRFMLELNNFSLMQYKQRGLPNLRSELLAKDEVAYLVGKYQAMSEQEALIPVAQTAEIWTQENPLEREKMLDTLKWKFLETEPFFYYFGIEKIIAHALQQQIAYRWSLLNKAGIQETKAPSNLANLLGSIIQKHQQTATA